MDDKVRSDYSKETAKLLQGIGKHDDPRLPPLDATAAQVLAFDLSQRSRLALRRVWLAGPDGQQLMKELSGQSSADGSSRETPQMAANDRADDDPATEDLLAEKFRRLTQRP